jgi:hypothetical protein
VRHSWGMTVPASVLADCISGYAARLQAVIGGRHHVASPLGAWLLLALAGPATAGPARTAVAEILGCDVGVAAGVAADLLAHPHPVVASAAAAWTAPGRTSESGLQRWLDGLPAQVTTGPVPRQAGLDAWAREHTFGLIDRFPIQDDTMYLVLASALATRVSWQVPFELTPAASLGRDSPWASEVSQVLRTPARGHTQFVAVTPEIGDVIVHQAAAADGLLVVSVGALPDVPPADVLAAAHRIGIELAAGRRTTRRDLGGLALGEGPLWLVREVTATADSCVAVLPAWSATSGHDLSDPRLGFPLVKTALAGPADPWQARQSAMARYTRTGFEAAAVTAVGVMLAAIRPARHREAELRFGHPYAVVALATSPGQDGPWHGLPVFSAWVSKPDEATDAADGTAGPAGRRPASAP